MTAPMRTLLTLTVLSLILGCGGEAATTTPAPTVTLLPKAPAEPSPTPPPTDTALPTAPPQPTATATPTPTSLPPVEVPPSPTSIPNPCDGLSGELEMRVLAGPAEVVGLEPYAVGSIPFSVSSAEAPYAVTGGGTIAFSDVLVREWGTYEVTMDLQMTINGECVPGDGGGTLQLDMEMAGSQMVKVDAGEFQGEYPWSGTIPFNLTFSLEEGAVAEGEGWAIVLHLNAP